MAKGSGGTRGGGASARGGSVAYFNETEKAVQLEMTVKANYYGTKGYKGDFVDQQKEFTQKVWIPKSQLENGKPTEWIAKQKAKEIMDYHSPIKNANKWSSMKGMDWSQGTYKLTDAKGKTVNTVMSKIEKQKAAAFKKGAQTHDTLVAQAKSMGIKGAHGKMKSSTLAKMITKAGGTPQW